MKRTILFILLTACALCGVRAESYPNVTINNISYNLNYNTSTKVGEATVIRKTEGKYTGAIVIPQKVSYSGLSFTVTKINYSAFTGTQNEVTSVTIPNTVTEIGVNAFYYCQYMKRLTIPASVTKIGKAAFSNCTFEALTLECTLSNYKEVFDGLNTSSIIFCKKSEINKIKVYFKGSVYEIGTVIEPTVSELEQDGLAFKLDLSNKTATVTGRAKNSTLGNLVVPQTVEANKTTYKVTTIAEKAFTKDANLVSFTMSDAVTTLGQYAFSQCYHLLSAKLSSSLRTVTKYAFYACDALNEVTIPYGVNTIGEGAFSGCSMLAYSDSLYLPASIRSIEDNAFHGCKNILGYQVDKANSYYSSSHGVLYKGSTLMSCPPRCGVGDFTVPDVCTTIGPNAFKDCDKITSITMGNRVTVIGNGAFWGCTAMKRIRLSLMLTKLGAYAFADCKLLAAVTLPRSLREIEMGDLFKGCKLQQLVVLGPVICPTCSGYGLWTAQFSKDWMASNGVIYTYHPDYFKDADATLDARLIPGDGTLHDVTSYVRGADFTVPVVWAIGLIKSVKVNDQDVTFNAGDGQCQARNLNVNSTYQVFVTYMFYTGYEFEDYLGTFTTLPHNLQVTNLTSTQTTITGSVSYTTDVTFNPQEAGVIQYDNGKRFVVRNGKFTLTGLKPYTSYYITPYARVDGNEFQGVRQSFSTKGVSPAISLVKAGPTSLEVRGSYTAGDAQVVSTSMTCRGTTVQGNTMMLTGLDPKSDYSVTFTVQFPQNGKESVNKSFSTIALNLNTLSPKVVKRGEAVVAAETNICDEETGAGFEWRKMDAPALVESKTAQASVYDGTLEGIIKNLDATAYYKVRPFYRSSSGQSYYGDWKGFDPSEFSYFEPTVHTYANVVVDGNKATLNGYALQGSDDIRQQGFEYWLMAKTRAAGSNVIRVTATGQRMTVVLTGLESDATYAYRAFVTTDRGTTYGEEYTFVTSSVNTAINGVQTVQPTTFDVYNMRGVRVLHQATTLEGLPRGLYIVNGRKTFIR